MDLESRIELQKIDCNCNDCKYMIRNLEKHKESVKLHHKWQLDYFNTIKNKLIEKSKWWKSNGESEKAKNIMKEVNKMKFQFDKSTTSINFGKCDRFKKEVSFIPNICQLETQECFEHRRV